MTRADRRQDALRIPARRAQTRREAAQGRVHTPGGTQALQALPLVHRDLAPIEQAMEEQCPERVVAAQQRQGADALATGEASFRGFRRDGVARAKGQLRHDVEYQPLVERGQVGDEEPVRATGPGRHGHESERLDRLKERSEIRCRHEDVDVMWRQLEPPLAAQQAPSDAGRFGGVEHRGDRGMDLPRGKGHP
jgi:hypothetical protein